MAGPSRKGNCSQREPQRRGRQPQEPDQWHVPHQDRCGRPQQVIIDLKMYTYLSRFKKSLRSIPKLDTPSTGKSLSEALVFAEHGENISCTEIVLNLKNNFCTQHVLPMV